jgi:hypothetical protein
VKSRLVCRPVAIAVRGDSAGLLPVCLSVSQLPPCCRGAAELDKRGRETAAELRSATVQLLTLLQHTAGPSVAGRLAEVLDSSSPGRSADLLGAALATDLADRLDMLGALDVQQRLEVALRLVQASGPGGQTDVSRAESSCARGSARAPRRAAVLETGLCRGAGVRLCAERKVSGAQLGRRRGQSRGVGSLICRSRVPLAVAQSGRSLACGAFPGSPPQKKKKSSGGVGCVAWRTLGSAAADGACHADAA